MKLYELLEARTVINKNIDQTKSISAALAYKIMKLMKNTQNDCDFYQEKFNAITILIKNKRVETQKYENKSDDNVNNYNYNYYIYNDGTLEELKDWAKWFLLKIGVEINDKVY